METFRIIYGNGMAIGEEYSDGQASAYQAQVTLPDGQVATVEHYAYGVTIRETRAVDIPEGWHVTSEAHGYLHLAQA